MSGIIIEIIKYLEDKKIMLESKHTSHLEKIATIEWENNRSAYEFFHFIDFLSMMSDEISFSFKENEAKIYVSDPSYIMILSSTIKNIRTLRPFTISLNSKDLVRNLKTRASDQRRLKLIFKDDSPNWTDGVEVQKIKGKSIIKKTQLKIDIELEEIPMDDLLSIEYPSTFQVPINILSELLHQAMLYSDILSITSKEAEGIEFSAPNSVMGDFKYIVPIDVLPSQEIEGFNKSDYALGFLSILKKLFSILKDDSITFSIKTDYPLRIDIRLENLDLDLYWFLAPRVEEADFDDDDDDDLEW